VDESNETFGQFVKLTRENLKLTQEEFGRRMGYGQSQVNAVETGKTADVIRFAALMIAAYGLDYKETMRRSGLNIDGSESEGMPDYEAQGKQALIDAIVKDLLTLPVEDVIRIRINAKSTAEWQRSKRSKKSK